MSFEVTVQRTIGESASKVSSAFADREIWSRWFRDNSKVDLRPGGRFTGRRIIEGEACPPPHHDHALKPNDEVLLLPIARSAMKSFGKLWPKNAKKFLHAIDRIFIVESLTPCGHVTLGSYDIDGRPTPFDATIFLHPSFLEKTPTLRDEAEQLRLALLMGLISKEEVKDWAEYRLIKLPEPPFELTDLVLATSQPPFEIATLLEKIHGSAQLEKSAHSILRLLQSRLETGDLDVGNALSAIGAYAQYAKVSARELEDASNLAFLTSELGHNTIEEHEILNMIQDFIDEHQVVWTLPCP